MTTKTRMKSSGRYAGPALANLAGMGLSASAGFFLAVLLSADQRGQYALVQNWFGLALVLGDFGIPAALVFYVASDPQRHRQVLWLSQRTVAISTVSWSILGIAVAPVLTRESPSALGPLRVALAFAPVAALLGLYMFTLQALSIRKWCISRVVQPGLYLVIIAVGALNGWSSSEYAVFALILSTFAQGAIGRFMVASLPLPPQNADGFTHGPLLKYGFAGLIGSTPALINTRLDQLLLSVLSRPQALAEYAVCVSLMSLAVPPIAAVGSVLFPEVAAARAQGTLSAGSLRRPLVEVLVAATLTTLALWVASLLLRAFVLHRKYPDLGAVSALLAPGTVALSLGGVVGDLLRGLGKPGKVAIAQGVGAAITIAQLVVLVPLYGARGAAAASSIAYIVVCLILIRMMHTALGSAINSGYRVEGRLLK